MRTTRIVVEEAASSPEICGTFTFSKSSRKSEISVEEVGSFSLNAPLSENVVSDHKEISINAYIEEMESDNDMSRKMSRNISIVSASEDEKISHEKEAKDDEMEKLLQRIQKQRNALDDIIAQDSTKVDDTEIDNKKSFDKASEAYKDENSLKIEESIEDEKHSKKENIEEKKKTEEKDIAKEEKAKEVTVEKDKLNSEKDSKTNVAEVMKEKEETKKTEEVKKLEQVKKKQEPEGSRLNHLQYFIKKTI